MSTQNGRILALLDAYNLKPTKRHLEKLGRHLGQIVDHKPYTYRHLLSVYKGYFEPGATLSLAIDAALAGTDGVDPLMAASVTTTIQTPPGLDAQHAYLPIEAKICSDPHERGCLNRFIPNVPWRSACFTCSPIRKD